MSVEYLAEKRAAQEKLALACTSNLRRMQELGQNGTFSFTDNWRRTKQHVSTHPQTPVLNQLSRIALNFDVSTWVTYEYWDGNLSAGLFQDISDEAKLVQLHESIGVEEIPFEKFSESDLVGSAKAIERNMKPATIPASILYLPDRQL